MAIWTPRPWQSKEAIPFALEKRRCCVFMPPGMGKTSTSYEVFDTLRLLGQAKRAIVFAPKRVAMNSWPDERSKWFESFGHLSTAVICGTPTERLAALNKRADICFTNYENIEWLLEVVGDRWPWDTVFADESTRLKGLRVAMRTSKNGKEFLHGQGSVRSKALARIAHTKVRNWFNLTGSPAPNGLEDLYGQMWFVDAGRRLGTSSDAFFQRWFRIVPGSDGYTKREPLRHAESEIKALIKDVCLTVDARDYFDLKMPIEHVIPVKLPPRARAIYAKMEKELFAEIRAGVEIDAFSASSKTNKLMQIGNGAVYTEHPAWEPLHDEKIEALKSVATEMNGEPILVRYCFIPDRERILKAFPKAKWLDAKRETVKDFQDGKIPMLVTHAASAGHGLDLQHACRTLVDFSTDYNLEHDEQILERVGPMRQFQIGRADRAVYRYRLIAEDTIEQNSALPRIKTKMSVQDSLKLAMKLRA